MVICCLRQLRIAFCSCFTNQQPKVNPMTIFYSDSREVYIVSDSSDPGAVATFENRDDAVAFVEESGAA